VNVAFYGGLVPNNLNEIEPLILAGVCGIKCFLVHSGIDEFPSVEKPDIEAAMQQMAKYQISLLAHCELEKEIPGLKFSANPGSYSAYLASRPKSWENEAVAMMIELSKKHDCPVHIVHVSSSEALALIEVAKMEGVKITAETCAHYLYFNAEDISDNNTLFKCAPPIRERENNLMLKNALASGVLDFITTDHSPAPPEIKEVETGNLLKAWGGIAGLQFLLPASWTAMKDIVSIENFIPMLTSRPAQFLKCNKKGKIEVGQEADLVIWSPESSFLVEEKDILHRHKLSPYTGEKLFGVVKQTIVGGESVFQLNKSESNLHKGKIFLAEKKTIITHLVKYKR
jgi:allantoinase